MDRNLEKIMKDVFRESIKDSIYYKAMKKSLKFWETLDIYCCSNLALIFKRVYMTDSGKSSILRQSLDCYVSERTLFRYRNDFIRMYEYFINYLKNETK